MERARSVPGRALGQLPRRAVRKRDRDLSHGPRSLPTAWTPPPTDLRARAGARARQIDDAEEGGGPADALARAGGVVDRRQRPGRVEVVVERSADLVEAAVAVAGVDPALEAGGGRRAGGPRATPSRGGSARPAASGGWPGCPTPCAGRRRTRGCRATSTSCARPSTPARRAASGGPAGTPVRHSDWAAEHSWWGKIRSPPPPWRSIVSVSSSRRASAVHSMCQPGRPGPHSESQAGSPSAEGCQSTKSSGSRLRGSFGSPPRWAESTSISSRG